MDKLGMWEQRVELSLKKKKQTNQKVNGRPK